VKTDFILLKNRLALRDGRAGENACLEAGFISSLPLTKQLPFSKEKGNCFNYRRFQKWDVICWQKFAAEKLIRGAKPARIGDVPYE